MTFSAAAADRLARIDAVVRSVLRGPDGGTSGAPPGVLVAVALAACCAHGAAMGSQDGRPLQAAISAAKVPLLLGGTTLAVLPNFLVVNTILGLRDDFGEALRAVLAAQASLAVALAAASPLVLVVYASTADYTTAVAANGVAFAAATACGHAVLVRRYRPLVARDARHRGALVAWGALYVFVAIQLAWVLRPFVGNPRIPTRFLREDAWSNAYVVVWQVAARVVGGE